MLVVDVEALSVEEQLTFAGLQGIVNRERPTLYLVGVVSAQDCEVVPSAEAWLADVVVLPHEEDSPDEALDRLLGRRRTVPLPPEDPGPFPAPGTPQNS